MYAWRTGLISTTWNHIHATWSRYNQPYNNIILVHVWILGSHTQICMHMATSRLYTLVGPYSDTTKLTHGGVRMAKPSQVKSCQVMSSDVTLCQTIRKVICLKSWFSWSIKSSKKLSCSRHVTVWNPPTKPNCFIFRMRALEPFRKWGNRVLGRIREWSGVSFLKC